MKLFSSRWAPALILLMSHGGMTTFFVLSALPERESVPQLPETTELAPRLWSFKTKAVDELIEALRKEHEGLAAERKNVLTAQAQMEAEKGELQKIRAELQQLRDGIDQRIVEIQADELLNLKTLSQTYAAMNPPAAVAILREMDENMVVKLLSLMKADRVGALLGEMAKAPEKTGEESQARRAARISDKLRLMKPPKKQSALSSL